MSNVPLPPIYENHAGKWIDVEDARAHAAAVSAAKDAEIERLRERVRVLEGALHHVDDCLSINDYGDYVLLDRFGSEIVTNALEK